MPFTNTIYANTIYRDKRYKENSMKQDRILVIDLGSTENTAVARAIRELGVY